MVSAWGMTAETAAEGEEALRKLATFHADVILTDLNMPGLDGFGFLARLRDAGEMPPAIVLTAYGNIETAVKTVHELGAYWFLEKPLQRIVYRLLIVSSLDLLAPWALQMLGIPRRPAWQRALVRSSTRLLCVVLRAFVPPTEPVTLK